MEFLLRAFQAKSLAGIATAASKDKTRPILTGVHTRIESVADVNDLIRITFTTTDSYRLAQHFLEVPLESGSRPTEPIEFLFDAHMMASQLKRVKGNDSALFVLPALPEVKEIKVSETETATVPSYNQEIGPLELRVFGGSGNTLAQVSSIAGKFPEVESLMRDIPWDNDWSQDTIDVPTVDDEPVRSISRDAAVALNPLFLSQVPAMLGADVTKPTPRQMLAKTPVQILVMGAWKPTAFKRVEQGEIVARGLLMPVRI